MRKVRSRIRPPQKYNDADLGKIIDRIYDDINAASTGVLDDAVRRINSISSFSSKSTTATPQVRPNIRFNQVLKDVGGDDVEYGQFKLWFEGGSQLIESVQFRFGGGQIVDADVAWIDLTGTVYTGSPATGTVGGLDYVAGFVSDPGLGEGGYWFGEVRIPITEFGDVLAMQVKAVGSSSEYGNWSYEFDADRLPRIISWDVNWGIWNTVDEEFGLRISVAADEDTGSIGYHITTSDYGGEIEVLDDSNFTLLANGRTVQDASIGSYAPSAIGGSATTYYVLVRAYSKIDKGTVDGEDAGLTTQMITIQSLDDPRDPSRINPLSIDSSQLVAIAQTTSILLTSSLVDYRMISVTGTITYVDTTSYTIVGGNVTLGASPAKGYYYAYFDPAGWTSDLAYGGNSATTLIQFTETEATAKANGSTGRRRFVGIAKRASQSTELAFSVMLGEEPVITAPIIQVVDLYALQATIGGWSIGSTYITDVNGTPGSTGMSSESGGSPNLRFWAGAANYSARNDAATPFRVYDDGSVVMTSATITGSVAGYAQAQRSDTPPTTRADATPLEDGDVWIDTNDGDKPYTWDADAGPAAWVASYTAINGSNITTGTINAARVFAQDITLTNWLDAGGMKFGIAAGGASWDGLYLNADNYWRDTGIMKVGSATDHFIFDGADIKVISNSVEVFDSSVGGGTFQNANIDTLTMTGDLTMGAGTKIIFPGAGYYSPNEASGGAGTFSVTGQAVSIAGGMIYVDDAAGSVAIVGGSTGAVSVGATSANLTLSTTTSGDIIISSAGNLTLGTVTSGTWSGTAIADAKIASAATWNAKIDTAGTGITKSGTTLALSAIFGTVDAWPVSVPCFDGDADYCSVSVSSYGATLIDDADAGTARTTLGLGSGVTGSFTETEFRNVGGGTGTEFRSRTNTLTNGIVTALGTFGSWTEVVAIL